MPYEGPISHIPLSASDIRQRLNTAADGYETQPMAVFTSIPNIERTATHVLLRHSTKGTLLQPAVDALNKAGIPTDPTIGGLQKSLGVGVEEIHDLGCECHGHEVYGSHMAARFKILASSRLDGMD